MQMGLFFRRIFGRYCPTLFFFFIKFWSLLGLFFFAAQRPLFHTYIYTLFMINWLILVLFLQGPWQWWFLFLGVHRPVPFRLATRMHRCLSLASEIPFEHSTLDIFSSLVGWGQRGPPAKAKGWSQMRTRGDTKCFLLTEFLLAPGGIFIPAQATLSYTILAHGYAITKPFFLILFFLSFLPCLQCWQVSLFSA